jgi:hypothetical protein
MTLELRLEREPSDEKETIGFLYEQPDHSLLCFMLEDPVRQPDDWTPGEPLDWKIAHVTAIPSGRYEIIITRSKRMSDAAGHDVFTPMLCKVPGFDGIRIHKGNKPEDTDGCLLPGMKVSDNHDQVLASGAAYDVLYAKIKAARDSAERVWITIVNPT